MVVDSNSLSDLSVNVVWAFPEPGFPEPPDPRRLSVILFLPFFGCSLGLWSSSFLSCVLFSPYEKTSLRIVSFVVFRFMRSLCGVHLLHAILIFSATDIFLLTLHLQSFSPKVTKPKFRCSARPLILASIFKRPLCSNKIFALDSCGCTKLELQCAANHRRA